MSRSLSTWLALAVCCAYAAWMALGVSMANSMGWDEAMHVAWPSARMVLHARGGEWLDVLRVLPDGSQYPFVYPLYTALVQGLFGLNEWVARAGSRALWGVGLFGLFLLAREFARGSRLRGMELAPWLVLVGAMTSPMAVAFSGSLYLEMPFVTVSIYALRAWLRREPPCDWRRDLAAGAWIATAFFTKFNYGLLLGFALFLDLALESALELRAGRARAQARRLALLALVPVLSFAWWFLLPWPADLATAAVHRHAILEWLGGNLELGRTPWTLRVVDWTCHLVPAPRVLVLLVLGMLVTVRVLTRRPVRVAWLAFLAANIPIWLHPFHHDRFLLPSAVLVWLLGGAGLAALLPAGWRARLAAMAVLAVVCLAAPKLDSWPLARAVMHPAPEQYDYAKARLAEFRDLRPARVIRTAGLARSEHDAFVDRLAPAVRPNDHIGWVAMSQEFPPAALLLALRERGLMPDEALLARDLDAVFVTLGLTDPGWSETKILEWARAYSVILTTVPPYLTARTDRAFLNRYHNTLVGSGQWQYTKLGSFTVDRGGKRDVEVVALRPTR